MKLKIGQRVWMKSGDMFKQATVAEITEEYIVVDPDVEKGQRGYGICFEKDGKKQKGLIGYIDFWSEWPDCGEQDEPWELVEPRE